MMSLTLPPVVILAGGQARRLGPLARETPKSLLSVRGQPFLGLLLDKLFREGFREYVLVLGHLHHRIEDFLRELDWAEPVDVRLCYDRGGTATALAAGLRVIKSGDRALVLNGDTVHDLEYRTLVADHDNHDVTMTIATTTRADVPNRGAVLVSSDSEVVFFGEGLPTSEVPLLHHRLKLVKRLRTWRESNCGCYVVSIRPVFSSVLSAATSFEQQVIPRLSLGGHVRAYSIGDRLMHDFGTMKRYRDLARLDRELDRIYGSTVEQSMA